MKWVPGECSLVKAHTADEIIVKACKLYIDLVHQIGLDNVILLNPFKEKGPVSVKLLDQRLQEILNPRLADEPVIKVWDIEFRKRDRVMQLRNTEEAKNGDVGYIQDIRKEAVQDDKSRAELACYIEFNGDGKLHRYTREGMGHMDLAYCSTVHKAQGSQYPVVISVVSHLHEVALRRNMVYTAFTRAQTAVFVVGELEALKKAIWNNKTIKRNTLLADRIHAYMVRYQQKKSA